MHAFLLAIALAAATGTAKSDRPPAKHIDIDDDEVVEGGVHKGDGDDVFARKVSKFGTLIKLRQDFRRELLRSGE